MRAYTETSPGAIARRVLLSAAVVTMLGSCAVQQKVQITASGAGTATMTLRLSNAVVRYLSDLQEMLVESPSARDGPLPVFDLEHLRSAFEAQPGVDLIHADTPTRETLHLEVAFERADELLAGPAVDGPEGPAVVSFTRTGGVSTLSVHLSRRNFGVLSGMFFVPESPLSVLVPVRKRDFFDKDEYIDLFSYAFEEYAEDEPIEAVLMNARLEISVKTDGAIVSQSGGTIVGDTVWFSVPVVDVLTLEEALNYSVSWR